MHRLNSLALGAALTAMLVLHAGAAEAARLTRSPYLQLVRPDSALVVFQTDTACGTAQVRYGESGDPRHTAPSKDTGTRHAVALTGLTPATEYTYVVEACGAFSMPRRLRTAPAPGTPRVHFVAVGDFGTNSSAQKQVAERMHQQRPELFLTLGDNVYKGDTARELDYQQKMFEPMAELLSEVPAFAALGNHDYEQGVQAQRFLDNFHLPTASGTERFYSFDWGHVHFVALDSTCAIGGVSLAECSSSKQKEWLEKDLAASQAPWKIVYFHHPPWSSGSHGPSKTMLGFSPLFEKHGVDLVLSGHEHDYERSRPMKGTLPAPDGIPYLVVGNGGTTLRPFTGPTPAWSAARNSTTHGFLDVVVEGGTLTARMLDTAGAVRDSLTLTKPLGDLPECAVAEQVAADELADNSCTPHPILGVIANGDDGNPPSNTLDDRLDTRWSQFGKGAWIDYDLGSDRPISGAAIAWHEGNTRTNAFTLSVSSDGRTYTPLCKGTSSGTTTAAETLAFAPRTARRLRITVQGNSKNDWASIAEARVCADSNGTSPSPPANAEWLGDFETGDDSQWTRNESVSPDRLQVVSSPVREGRFALKVTVKQGDDPINASGNRSELMRKTLEPEGSEYAYRWSTRFAPDFPSAKHWQLFTQWHHLGNTGSPPVEFYVLGEELHLKIGGTTGTILWRAPLVRDVWHDFVFHVKWSPNPKVGFVELYHNGKLVLPKRFIATQYDGQRNYLKLGLYRDERVAQTGVLYHDGFTMTRRLEDVLPAEAFPTTAEVASTSVP